MTLFTFIHLESVSSISELFLILHHVDVEWCEVQLSQHEDCRFFALY